MQGALLDRLVDPGDQPAVLGLDGGSVPRFDGALEPPEVGLDGTPQAAILQPFSLGSLDALAL